jgi:ribulose-phosphate 3-epimerase/protein sgcE
MFISPSVASGDVLNLETEVRFAEEHFSHVHIDVEDGVYLHNISFGFKTVHRICAGTNAYKSLHLMLHDPASWIQEVSQCGADIAFIHVDHLSDPISVLCRYREADVNVGLGLSDRDLENKRGLDYQPILATVSEVIVLTARLDDPNQRYDDDLHEYVKQLCASHKVWVDGGISTDQFPILKASGINGIVMGRAIFNNKKGCPSYKELL